MGVDKRGSKPAIYYAVGRVVEGYFGTILKKNQNHSATFDGDFY
jgi:hypothetical protein